MSSFGNLIFRDVNVNRSLSPAQALGMTGRRHFIDENDVKAMPKISVDSVDVEMRVFFFNLGCQINDYDLRNEYALRQLVPCDPFTLTKINADDPTFADDYPNATHWKDAYDKWCFAAFGTWGGHGGVRIGHGVDSWSGDWWFAGVFVFSQRNYFRRFLEWRLVVRRWVSRLYQ